MNRKSTVAAYRRAAKALFGANKIEQALYVVPADQDGGQWAPAALAVIYLEPNGAAGDRGRIPAALDYYSERGIANCERLAEAAGGSTYVEYINAAVAAVYPY